MDERKPPVVLVVDDNEDYRLMLVSLLSLHGYGVLDAATAEQGLSLLHAKQQVEVLVADVRLPKVTGEEMVVQALETRPDLKVIFLAGFPGDLRGNWRDRPGTAVLCKPARIAELVEAIERCMREAKADRSDCGRCASN